MRAIVGPAKVVMRLLALVGRELVETARRPGALASLVFGPFLVLAVFGVGYGGFRRPLATILVVPPESGLATDAAPYRELAGPGLEIVDVVTDRATAEARLRAGEVDVVAAAPADAAARFAAGEQSRIEVLIDLADPVQAAYASFMAGEFSAAVNRAVIRRAAEEGLEWAVRAGRPDAARIPPEVIAAPTTAEVVNLAPVVPTMAGFFGPAVLALILQHMAVSLVALSVVRERTSGVMELFRIAPVGAWELAAGKLLGFGVLCGAVAALTVVLLVGLLGVPLLGPPAAVAGVLALLVAASLGIGLLVALVADSERQAVQLALLVLLASVFFSGLALPIAEFTEPVRVGAHALPVTSAIRVLQDLMLRGTVRDLEPAWVLAGLATGLPLLAWLVLRRRLSHA